VPWAGLVTEPRRVAVDALPEAIAARLRVAGFSSCFHTGAHAPDHETTLRLVACSATEYMSAEGPLTPIRLTRELLSVIAAKAYNDRVIAHNANRDDLTGLPNRIGLLHHFDGLQRSSADCGIMFVDIDDFKHINDAFGHPAGDRVLSAVAERLIRSVRPDDFVCRIGGDEFAIVLSDSSGRLGAGTFESLAARVVEVLGEPVMYQHTRIPLTASVGVAKAGPTRDLDELMSRADGAMYRAKRAGGGRHHLDRTFAA
jgi:diguanylate cyclase (GGDEF)-like protein